MSQNSPFKNWSDEELMQAYIQGNYQAYELLYFRHKNKIWSYFYLRTQKNEQITAELFQESLLKLHNSRERFKKGHKLLPWLYTIAHNTLVDFYRKKKDLNLDADQVSKIPNNESDYSESGRLDWPELNQLSPKEREILSLRFESDLDYKDVANILNIEQPAARKIMSRAIGKLKKLMGA